MLWLVGGIEMMRDDEDCFSLQARNERRRREGRWIVVIIEVK